MRSLFELTDGNYVAQHMEGIETLISADLQQANASFEQPGFRATSFSGSHEAILGLILHSGIINRVLAQLITFNAFDPDQLYKHVKAIEWHRYFSPSDTFAVSASVYNSRITHSQYAALTVKDAIVDQIRLATGRRPSVNTSSPAYHFVLNIAENQGFLNIDLSGPMHERQYRSHGGAAPMRETLAAVIARMVDEHDRPVLDLMTGSGTLLIEAWLQRHGIPPSILKNNFPFMRFPELADIGRKLIEKRRERITASFESGWIGNDKDPRIIAHARMHSQHIPGMNNVIWQIADYRKLGSFENKVILINPPYGIRMKNPGDIPQMYKELGDFLKHQATGSAAYIYFGDRSMIPSIGLRTRWKRPLKTGALDGRLAKFELY